MDRTTAGVLSIPFVVCLPLALAGLDESSLLAYSREAIVGQGQYWRLLTGHGVHTDLVHALMNLAAWPFVFWLAHGEASARQWALGFLFCVLGVDAGLWWFSPDVAWYVGLSGVLHGVLVWSALAAWRQARFPALAVLLGVAAKLLWEQIAGPLPGSETWIGHRVVVDAHLYGALSGGLCGVLCFPKTMRDFLWSVKKSRR